MNLCEYRSGSPLSLKVDGSEFVFRRFSGDFTDVIVPETSNISWSIPVDTITLLLNGSNKRVVGSLASVDMYRPHTFPFLFYCCSNIRCLSLC